MGWGCARLFTEELYDESYLLDYAKMFWQEGMPNCPVGGGVGFED
jgi:hypothetical protein